MRNLLGIMIALICLAMILPAAHAAKANKTKEAAQSTKEKLVLMPLRVPEEDKNLIGAMETALVEGLQQKYVVFSGEQVAQKAREIFLKETRNTAKKDCDETRCMQDIAMSFQAELIATANVTKREGGYFLALSIQNIFDNKVEYSKSTPCKGCDSFQVVDKLKELSGATAPVAATPQTAAEPEAPKIIATDPDDITWAEAQKGNTVDDYQIYLDAYPKGKYISFAKVRIKKLNEAIQAAADAKLKAIGEEETKFKVPEMVAIPGRNYEMGKYEVTQKEWRDIMGNNPSNFSDCGDTCPVEQVSWEDVQTFLQKLNSKTGRQYRLPTEAEWEFACYGGSQREYCGGNDIDSVAWYSKNSDGKPHPAGQKQANGYGLYDMSGNVWEWCAKRVLRGGSWGNDPNGARSAYRSDDTPAGRNVIVGFRVARTLP